MTQDSNTLTYRTDNGQSKSSELEAPLIEPRNAIAHSTGAAGRGQDLRGADFSQRDLVGADFGGADLSGARFSGANLTGAKLVESTLSGAQFLGANLSQADLSDCQAEGAGFGAANLSDATLFGSNLKGATLTRSTLKRADLRASRLEEARLCDVDLSDADLFRADLRRSDLTNANVKGARLTECDLTGSRLRNIRSYGEADWIGADVRDADFRGGFLLRRTISDQNYLHEFRNHSKRNALVYWMWWVTSDCGRSISRWVGCIAIIIVAFAAAFEGAEVDWGGRKNPLSSLYFSVVTFTTLGYGDVLPASQSGQMLAIAEVLIGYVMLGGLLSIFANKMSRRAD